MQRPLALLLQPQGSMATSLSRVLADCGLETLVASDPREALELVRSRGIALVVADLSVAAPGAAWLGQLRRERPSTAVVALTPRGDDGSAVEALRGGALDAVPTDAGESRLRVGLERALAHHATLEELQRLRTTSLPQGSGARLVGHSSAVDRLRERLDRLAGAPVHVLFVGERGSGKEAAARALHALSPRRDRPFVVVDGEALRPDALRTELFGADPAGHAGALRLAEGGSIFLDGVASLPEDVQARLASLLPENLEDPTRGVRVLTGDPGDLGRAVQEGRFREDLHRRLAGAIVELPPLRARTEDVVPLARHIVETVRSLNQLGPVQLSAEALERLRAYPWPGNERELWQALEQAILLAQEGVVRPEHLPAEIRESTTAPIAAGREAGAPTGARRFREAKREVVEAFERVYLQDLLQRHGGNVTAAAHQAGMLRSALQRLLRKYDLRSAEYRRPRRRPELSGTP